MPATASLLRGAPGMNGQVATAEQCRATCRIMSPRDVAAARQAPAEAALTPALPARRPQIPEESGGDPLEIAGTRAAGARGSFRGLCCESLRIDTGARPGTPRTARVRPPHTQWAGHWHTRVHAQSAVRGWIRVSSHRGRAECLRQSKMRIASPRLTQPVIKSHKTSSLPCDNAAARTTCLFCRRDLRQCYSTNRLRC